MAENIMAMVGLRRGLIEGTETADVLHEAIAKYATAQLYKSTAQTLTRLRRDVVGLLAREFLPYAAEVGKASAKPVLDALGGTKLVEKGNAVRGRVLQGLQTYHKNNLLAFRAAMNQEVGTLGGEIEAAFARGARDGVARKQLIDDLVASHKGEMARLADVRVEIESKADALADAERRLGEAGKRTQREAKRNVAKASKELTKAKAMLGTAKDFFGRFETRIQGHVRDTIRREAETAQTAAFRQAGYSEFTWIAVNGEAACPSCSALHGTKLKGNEANTMGPGSRDTYCGSSCMCVLVPDDYAKGNESLTKPLRRPPRPPKGEDVSAGRPGMAPIKLGGDNARLAKRAAKRAKEQAETTAKFVPEKTVAEAEASLLRDGVQYVELKGMTVEQARALADAVHELPVYARPKLVSSARGVFRALGGRKPGRPFKSFYGVHVDAVEIYRDGKPTFTGGQMMGINAKDYKTLGAVGTKKEMVQAAYQKRHGRDWFFNTDGSLVPRHEAGHVLRDALRGDRQAEWEWLARRWKTATPVDILKNEREAFAEAWAAFKGGGRSRLPSYVQDFMAGL